MNDYSKIYSEIEINSMSSQEHKNVKGLFNREIFEMN